MIKQYRKRQFISHVKKGLPKNFSSFDIYFYAEPLGHIFSGILADRSRWGGSLEISRFLFPLYAGFAKNRMVHLGYSKQFPHPDGCIFDDDFDDIKALVAEFLSRTEDVIKDAHRHLELDAFYNYLQNNPSEDPRWQQVSGYTQVLLGNTEKALDHLNSAVYAKVATKESDPELWALRDWEQVELDQWKQVLEQVKIGNMNGAKTILLANENELKINLGITSPI